MADRFASTNRSNARARASRNFRARTPRLGARLMADFHKLIHEYLDSLLLSRRRATAESSCKTSTPNPRQRASGGFGNRRRAKCLDELFENDTVKTLVLSQMAIPRGVARDYAGGGIEVLQMIAGDEKPELARGGVAFDRPGVAAGLRSQRRPDSRGASRRKNSRR